ncbi:MAG: hypothetical protein H8E42_13020 [Nitrospinae bacterium]|nr:hypothetical protein [Nitrospinota bacterium]MBL7020684.1 hypothetical protein [Nitrospinaceae bacterium]
MKKTMRLVLIGFSISFLVSCASNGIILPNTVLGAVKTYSVNDKGTVKILGQDMMTEPTHWLYVECEHWSGCYMRCQGQIKSCKKVATDSQLDVDYIFSRFGSQK